jgi:FtsZ-binding cell division protein ZapB
VRRCNEYCLFSRSVSLWSRCRSASLCRFNNTYHPIYDRLLKRYPSTNGIPSGQQTADLIKQLRLSAWVDTSSSKQAKETGAVLAKATRENKYAPYPELVGGKDIVDPGSHFTAWLICGPLGAKLPAAMWDEVANTATGLGRADVGDAIDDIKSGGTPEARGGGGGGGGGRRGSGGGRRGGRDSRLSATMAAERSASKLLGTGRTSEAATITRAQVDELLTVNKALETVQLITAQISSLTSEINGVTDEIKEAEDPDEKAGLKKQRHDLKNERLQLRARLTAMDNRRATTTAVLAAPAASTAVVTATAMTEHDATNASNSVEDSGTARGEGSPGALPPAGAEQGYVANSNSPLGDAAASVTPRGSATSATSGNEGSPGALPPAGAEQGYVANSNPPLGDAAASVTPRGSATSATSGNEGSSAAQNSPDSTMQQSQGIAAGTTILAPSGDLVYENGAMGFPGGSCETIDDAVAGGSVASSRKRAATAKSDPKRGGRNKRPRKRFTFD